MPVPNKLEQYLNMKLATEIDRILDLAVAGEDGEPGVPGVVAMAATKSEVLYQGSRGVRCLSSGKAMSLDTILALMSCTKAITGAAAMQLWEQDVFSLDDLAKKYAPEIEKIPVLHGFSADGSPITRPAETDITIRHLLLHTAGFGYDFFNIDLVKYGKAANVPSIITAKMDSLKTVLLFDPGTRWEYGTSIDWLGKVIEGAMDAPLGEVLRKRILEPLGMNDTDFQLSQSMDSRRSSIHQRADGKMVSMPDFVLPQSPEQHMGGHFLYGSAVDYIKFIQMVLNDGVGCNGRVLQKSTVDTMTRNHLAGMNIKPLPGVLPSLSGDAEFFPGQSKSWGYTWMINDETAPTGRPMGSAGWAGLANTFYWIDRQNGVGGFWGSQLLPFVDRFSTGGYLDFEKAIYSRFYRN